VPAIPVVILKMLVVCSSKALEQTKLTVINHLAHIMVVRLYIVWWGIAGHKCYGLGKCDAMCFHISVPLQKNILPPSSGWKSRCLYPDGGGSMLL
jgi:hypothetical protein